MQIINFCTFKDKLPSLLHSGIVYRFQCGGCMLPIMEKLTGKRVKSDDDSTIKEHLSFCYRSPAFEDISVFTINNNDFKVTLMESSLINTSSQAEQAVFTFGTF